MPSCPEFRSLRNERGAVFITVLLAAPLLFAAVLSVAHLHRTLTARARLQELADTAAMRAAAAQAASLNAVALLNDAILGLEALSAGVYLIGNGAAAGLDVLVVTAPEGVELHQASLETTDRLRETAVRLADLQDALARTLPFTPLLAAESVALTEGIVPPTVLLPYPLPGWDGELSLGAPFGGRRLEMANLSRALATRLVALADDAAGPAARRFRAASKKAQKLGCGRWTDSAPERYAVSVRAACKASKNVGKKSFAKLLGDSLPKSKGDAKDAWPLPLVLVKSYSRRFQVGVAAVAGEPLRSARPPSFAVGQARAVSLVQTDGGDLYVPDFSPRLVPVRLPAEATAMLQLTGEGAWRFWH